MALERFFQKKTLPSLNNLPPGISDALFLTFWKDGKNLEDRSKYSLNLRASRDKWEGFIHWETPDGIKLIREGHIIAGLGFSREKESLVVRQIQGGVNRKLELSAIKWERLLLAAAIEVARINNLSHVEVAPAGSSQWQGTGFLSSLFEKRLPAVKLMTMKLRYEVTPERMGFKLAQNGNRIISIANWDMRRPKAR